MLLKIATWGDIEMMPCFEREYFYKEAAEAFRDKKTGEIRIR